MLCGVPTAGKSTAIKFLKTTEIWKDSVVLSTDNYIEREAQKLNLTYNDIFEDTIKDATLELELELKDAVSKGLNIIHDQTNITVKSRKNKLNKIPSYYHKSALYFQISIEEALKRNHTREGKFIPESVIKRMCYQFEIPTLEEGFDDVSNGVAFMQENYAN